MGNEVKLTFRIDDDGTLAVFDRAGTKLRDVKGAADGVGSSFSKVGAAVITANQAVALFSQGLDVAQRLVGGLVNKIQEMDNIGETAKRVGLTARELSSLRLAAQQGGVSIENIARSSQFLSRQIVAASDATSKQAALFRELGVDTSRGLLPTLVQLGRVFDQLPDGADKTALAIALMGREGAAQLNVLNATLEESIKKNGELGMTLSDETAAGASKAADAIDEMSGALGGLGEAIASRAAGPLTQLANLIEDVATAGRGVLSGQTPLISSELSAALGVFTGGVAPESAAPPLNLGTGPSTAFPANAGPQLPPNQARIRALLSGSDSGSSGGGGGGRKGANPGKALAQQTAALDADVEDRERAIVGLLEAQGTLREEAVRRAEEQLRVAQQNGASAATQLALAEQIDQAERAKLLTLKEQLETQLMAVDLPPIAGDVSEVAQLQAELQIVNERLAEAPSHVRDLTEELSRANDVVIDLGESINNSLQRAVDGFLNSGGGKIDFVELIRNTLKAQVSSVAGGALEAIIGGGELKIGGLDKLEGVLSRVGDLFSRIFGGSISSARAVEGAAGSTAVRDSFGSILGFASDASGVGSSAVGTAGTSGGGSSAVAGIGAAGAGLASIYALPTAAVAAYLGSQLINGISAIGHNKDATLGGHVSTTSEARRESGLFGPGAITAAVVVPIIGQFYAIIAAIVQAFISRPTEGTQRAIALQKALGAADVPQQLVYERGGRKGVRAQYLTNAPGSAAAAAFAEAGFGFDQPGLKQPTIEQLAASGKVSNPAQLTDLQQRLNAAAAANPGVESLRTNEALGLGVAVTGTKRGGTLVANLLTNNFELLGISAGEAHREMLKLARSTGIDLVNGLEEINRAYRKHKITDDQLVSASQGLTKLFSDDLPKSVKDQLPAILARNTNASGVDIAGVQIAVDSAKKAYDYREQVKDIRYSEMNARGKERELRARLAKIDSDLATTTDDKERQRLLQERAKVGLDYVTLAQSRYGEGTAQRRRAVEYGLNIVEDTSKKLEEFGVEVVDASKEQTTATQENTNASLQLASGIKGLRDTLEKGVISKLDINFDGDENAVPAVLTQIKKELAAFIKSPEFRAAVRENTKAQ